MSEAVREFIMYWLDPVGIVVGLLISIPVLWTWYEVTIGRRRRERKWHRQISRQPGERPGILIVDLLPGKDIRATVENHIRQDEVLKDIPPDRIFHIRREKPLAPRDMSSVAEDLRKTAAQAMTCGVDTIHCHYAGPAVVAALIGAEFANGCRVLLYQHDNGRYVNFGPLKVHAEP